MIEAPAGRLTAEIALKPIVEEQSTLFQPLEADPPRPEAGGVPRAIGPCRRIASAAFGVLAHDVPISQGLRETKALAWAPQVARGIGNTPTMSHLPGLFSAMRKHTSFIIVWRFSFQ